MEKKTLSLNVANRSGTQATARKGRRRKRLTEVVVESGNRRRVVLKNRGTSRTSNRGGDKSNTSAKHEQSDRRKDIKLAAVQAFEQEVQRKVLEQEQQQREDEQRNAIVETLTPEPVTKVPTPEVKLPHPKVERQKPTEAEPPKADNPSKEKITTEPRVKTPAETKSPKTVKAVKEEKPAKAETEKQRPATNKRQEKKRRDTESKGGGKDQKERRRQTKIDVATAMSDEVRQRSHAAYLRSQERKKRKAKEPSPSREKVVREVQLPESIIVQELANRMAERVADVVKVLMRNGVFVNQNQTIDADTAELIVGEFGHKTVRVSAADVEDVIATRDDAVEDLKPRSAVVSVMGHVDHGKTSLLDSLRKTNVVSSEAGGITQHIGAYQVKLSDGKALTFLDTPGHAAFTAMRARGAQITDIVVLVVAADDAVMPQTIEAINHAQAANVPIIVAINKVDLVGSEPDKVRSELLRHNVIVEKHSGDVLDVEISALTGQGVDKLLEAITLQAEILELRANPDRRALGAVIESRLDQGRGPVATILVQKGTLRKGDVFVVGNHWGKARALVDDSGNTISSAGPSMPVEIIGLSGTPQAGDILNVVENESQAKEISKYRQSLAKDKRLAAGTAVPLDELMKLPTDNEKKVRNLELVVKADVQGSAEAIVQAVEKIGNDEVNVRVIHSGVGAITETDISLAEASNAQVVGFNVRANVPAKTAAAQKQIDIRYYSVIYALVDDIRASASNLLSAEVKETFIGSAEILEIFKITGAGNVAGCRVTDGHVRRSAGVRLLRDNVVIHEGRLKTLKRFKDEVNEVVAGQECGMAFENYANLRKGDSIEVFEREEIERTL